MTRSQLDFAFVLGSGFSSNAGMPTQAEFTEALLGGRGAEAGQSGSVVEFLRGFVSKAFNHGESAKAKHWPELEDLFTCVDLSANTGHNLGPTFNAGYLRTVRRALIYRIFTMLRERYKAAQEAKGLGLRELDGFFKRIPWAQSVFISTNWDTVLEEKLEEVQHVASFDYGCGAIAGNLHPDGLKRLKVEGSRAKVVKLHGSINWLYCDACRKVFWLPPGQSNKVAGQLLGERDWEIIEGRRRERIDPYLCIGCGADALGTRLATFSFRKALDFPMFEKSWFAAERWLRRAKTWVFVGYSLPAADFEFKFLLKRVQLSRENQPNFVLISKGEYANKTFDHYQHFFGRGFHRDKRNFFENGMTKDAISYILGCTDEVS
jgi:hypothetical protein